MMSGSEQEREYEEGAAGTNKQTDIENKENYKANVEKNFFYILLFIFKCGSRYPGNIQVIYLA